MAQSKLAHDLQAAVDCDLCEGHVKVDWRCLTCPANLCEKCHVLHTSRKNFRKHKVITRESFRRAQRGGATPGHTKCATHTDNDVTFNCVTCQIPVCVECVPTAHNGHKFESLDVAISRSRTNLGEFMKNLVAKETSIASMIHRNSKVLNESRSQSDQTKKQINKAREVMVSLINKEADKLIQEVDKNAQQTEDKINKSNRYLQTKKDTLEHLMTSARSLLEVQTSENIDKFLYDNSRLDSADTADTPEISLPSFQAQPLSSSTSLGALTFETSSLMKTTGKRPSLSDVRVIRIFDTHFRMSEIRSSGESQAWCSRYNSVSLKLLDKKGKEMKSLEFDFKIQGFVKTKIGNFIICDLDKQCIKEVTLDGRVRVLCSTSPLWPWGICLNDQQQPVVCLGKSLVVHSPDCHTKLCDFTHDQQGRPLFEESYKVDTNGDSYCVVDDIANQVVNIDRKGGIRWTYRGGPRRDEEFCPMNICCDRYQNVIVADPAYNVNKVHLLDKDGQFIMYFTEKVSINRPRGVCVMNNEELWVGGDARKIHMISYIKQ